MNHQVITLYNDLMKRKYYSADYSIMGLPGVRDIFDHPYFTYVSSLIMHDGQTIEQAINTLAEIAEDKIYLLIDKKSNEKGIPKKHIVIHWRELPHIQIGGKDRLKMSYRCSVNYK